MKEGEEGFPLSEFVQPGPAPVSPLDERTERLNEWERWVRDEGIIMAAQSPLRPRIVIVEGVNGFQANAQACPIPDDIRGLEFLVMVKPGISISDLAGKLALLALAVADGRIPTELSEQDRTLFRAE